MPKIGERFNPHRMFDGVFIPEAICQYRGISPGAKLAYGRFCRFAGKAGEIFPSMETLGKEIGCSASQARSYVHELKTEKFVEVETDKGKSNTYYFLWHPAFEGEIGSVRFQPPLQDAGGVPSTDTPPGCWRGGLQDAGGVPLQDAGGERESVEESHLKESETPPSPSFSHPRLDALEKPAKETEYVPYGRSKKSRQSVATSARLREMREHADFTTPSGNGFHPNGHAAGSPGEPPPVVAAEQQVVATWNRIVPASPAAYDARADRAAMVKLSSNALFLENIEPICQKAQKIHEADPEGSGWLKLWMLPQVSKNGQPHWRRLMNGDYDFMMNPERHASSSSSGDDLAARVDAKFQKRAEESKKKAERKQK